MSKSKSSSKVAKPSKPDTLTKVKDAAVTKPAQKSSSKSKDVAKSVATKEEKKSKKSKKVKEPTPEPESDDDDSESSESSEDEKVAPVKANGAKKAVAPVDDDDSDEDSSEDDGPAATGVLGAAPAVTEADSDSDDSSEDEAEAKPVKATKVTEAAKAESSDEDSSEDDAAAKAPAAAEDSDDDSEDSSDDEEVEAKPQANKRKAEADAEPAAKKTKTAESSVTTSANLFIGNLSWNVDEAWLKETFEEHGEIARVQLITDRATGRSKGFGYVEFVNAEDAAAAHAAKQGHELDNRTLNVDFSNPRPPKQDAGDRRKSYGDQVSEPSDTLFLGNLSFDVGQETVTESFSPHGTIMGIRLPTDRETGEPKGFGYVTFASVDEAKAALEAMQGGYIGGRPVRLDYSQPRPQNDGGGGGRGGGRGGFGGRGRGGDRGGRGRGFGGGRGGDRGGRGFGGRGRGGSTNRGGFGDFKGSKVSFD